MRTVSLALLVILSAYLVAWLSMYTWVMGGDMSYLAEYFRLGWAGGGERPGLIQLYALILAFGISAFVFMVMWAFRRMNKAR